MRNVEALRTGIVTGGKYLLFVLFFFIDVFPLIWILMSSLKTDREFAANVMSLPQTPSFRNYADAWRSSKIGTYFFNSVYVTAISGTVIVGLSLMISHVLARYRFRLRKFVYFFFLLGMLIPVHTTLVPLFIMFRSLGALNRWFTLLIPYVGFGLPLAVFILESFIRTSVPLELEEAATLDGCGHFRALWRVVAPMCKPAIAAVCIMTFLFVWNDFAFPLIFISREGLKTLQLGLMNYVGPYATDYTQMMAALMIATLPIMLAYFIFRKQLIKGMVAGALKG